MKIHQKLSFPFLQVLFHEHVEEVPRHDLTVRISNPIILHIVFYCQIIAFVFEFQHTSMWKIKLFSRLYRSYEDKNYMDMYQTHLGTRSWRDSFQKKKLKLVFLAHKTPWSLLQQGKTNFFFNFERYDLTNGKEFESKIQYTSTCTS